MDAYIGEIRAFPYDYPPEGWLFCNGARVSTTQFQALSGVIAGIYGPYDSSTFTLPNLLGRTPMGFGNAAYLSGMPSAIPVGTSDGNDTYTLTTTSLPPHTHTVKAAVSSNTADYSGTPGPTVLLSRTIRLDPTTPYKAWSGEESATTMMHGNAIAATGGNQAHENCQPALTFRYCICHDGMWPTRP